MDMYSEADIQSLVLTVKLATITTLILLLVATPLAWWLARCKTKTKALVSALIALPLILPPSVLGFYLLLAMGPSGPFGMLTESLSLPSLAFSFPGLVLASVIYSLPFVVQPIHNAITSLGPRPIEVAATLGASPIDTFLNVVVPLARPGIITGAILGFAHTVGEFGVILMIGGNIPGVTQVVSVQIYEHVEALNYAQAHTLSITLLVFSFVVLALVYSFQKPFSKRIGSV